MTCGVSPGGRVHPLTDEGVSSLLALLPAEAVPLLVHLLECPECQDCALADLAPALETPLEEPRGPLCRPEAERLLGELLQAEGGSRLRALNEPRFHRMDLLDLALDEGDAALTGDAEKARILAALAVSLGSLVDPGGEELRPRMVRAFCLEASARRLQGNLDAAAIALDNASFFLSQTSRDQGLYCRVMALLRWEQGHLTEAAALLRYAAHAWAEAGSRRDQGVCLALLGLLYVEMEDFRKAPGPLVRGLLGLAGHPSSLLPVQCSLSLFLSLATVGRGEEARKILEETWLFYALLEPPEQIWVRWLEGKGAARLGAVEEAASLLDSARRKLLADRRLPDAALCTLDLAALYVETDRQEEVSRLIAELAESTAGLAEADLALDVLRQFAGGELTRETVRWRAAALAIHLRQTFRARGLGGQTLPWV